MLTIIVPESEAFDPITETFFSTKEQKLVLEHSLFSIAKWESKWNKVFLDKRQEKTIEESRDYIRCMTITQNVDPNVYYSLTDQNYQEILDYIKAPMTATWFSNDNRPPSREIITSEVIYYYMTALQIPFECDKWHLNRLMTLIHVCSEKNKSPTKMGRKAVMSKNQALNQLRRQRLGTTG